ncbi:hypothetical protein CU098_008713 [Rhizopus stolonifer]|uniref:Uncharacterized protein n=1 Tax=Rhizopus stolonifer TaxID=4846 RepID=A0A367KM59_RHIST|nr:hypothetical protein CU098_008713 [Rhizopus stolonifer]
MNPQMNLVDPDNQTMNVPEFPSRNGPQRLVAAATKQPRNREKVRLEPGHSPLDWAKLCNSGQDLRGVPQLGRYTLEEVRQHRTQEDAWTAIQGKATFWNPRADPDNKKPADKQTFDRPRLYDFSSPAWNRKYEIWYQKEPMVEYEYTKQKK